MGFLLRLIDEIKKCLMPFNCLFNHLFRWITNKKLKEYKEKQAEIEAKKQYAVLTKTSI